jgi:hypothetical protein
VIQFAELAAVQGQPAATATVTVPDPPLFSNVKFVGVIVITQTGPGSVGDFCLSHVAVATITPASSTTTFAYLMVMAELHRPQSDGPYPPANRH